MLTLSFSFRHLYETNDDADHKARLPIRLRLGDRFTDTLLPDLDTGSIYNIFRAEIAESLDVSYQKGDRTKIRTATGSFYAYRFDVTLEIIGMQSIETAVYFAPWQEGVGPEIGVLGMQDFATKLKIGMVHYERLLYLSDYNEP